MFTQCAKCETVFRLSAEVLRAAGGQVRCGRCGEVFNALARLAEDASAFPPGESPLEMEERADEILQSTVPPLNPMAKQTHDVEDTGGGEVEYARLQVLEKFIEDLPPSAAPPVAPVPAPASKPPVETAAPLAKAAKPAPPPPAPPSAPAASPKPPAKPAATKPATPAHDPNVDPEISMEFTLPPGELDRIFVEPAPGQLKTLIGAAIGEAASAESQAADPGAAPRNRTSGLEVPDEVRREMLSGMSGSLAPDIELPRRRELPRKVWLGAAAVLGLSLIAQLVHGNRGWIGMHAPLHGLYSALGLTAATSANLSAYQLRQWGVTGEPGAAGTLRVRASILNTAAQLQPYPLLRVTLANRFGSRIGARDFEPAEYLGKPTVRLLAPGEHVDATLDIVDPGKDAEGFEIDVCLRGVDQRISCAADAAPQSKK